MTPVDQRATVTRPLVHFTAPSGWLNDPHGLCWLNGEYHLFYQYNPDGREWDAAVHWGHATSPDLVHWQHRPIALSPHDGEGGCWTGDVVVEDGVPTIFYTSVPSDDWSLGRIAVAHPEATLTSWASGDNDVLIDGPPAELGAFVFRDPCIIATDDGWAMIVGVGVVGAGALAVQYLSTDRRHWTYDGVLCSRSAIETEGIWTGGMWECPQLFRVGVDWVLAVSVWDADRLFYVAAAVGEYDGHTFTPERWSRLSYDDISYAMTSFTDRDGFPGVMFWLREESDHDTASADWAGALSLPLRPEIASDRTVRLRPHPDLDLLGATSRDPQRSVGDATVVDVEVRPGVTPWTLTVGGNAPGLTLVGNGTGHLTAQRPDRPDTTIPVRGEGPIRVIVDAGIVEVFAGSGYAALRTGGVSGVVTVSPPQVRHAIRPLEPAFSEV